MIEFFWKIDYLDRIPRTTFCSIQAHWTSSFKNSTFVALELNALPSATTCIFLQIIECRGIGLASFFKQYRDSHALYLDTRLVGRRLSPSWPPVRSVGIDNGSTPMQRDRSSQAWIVALFRRIHRHHSWLSSSISSHRKPSSLLESILIACPSAQGGS